MEDQIRVRVRAFASLREALGAGDIPMTVDAGTTVASLLAEVSGRYPGVTFPKYRFTVAVNRVVAPQDAVLKDGDEIALIPPVSGGSAKRFEITEQPLSADEVAARVVAPDMGGVTLFLGTVRGLTGEITTDYLEYEAYPEMAEGALERIAGEVREKWPSIAAVSIVHRVGKLAVGDLAVVIAVASAHRQDTFAACQYAIDRIKQVAPIWKREVGPDGAVWVEGPESHY